MSAENYQNQTQNEIQDKVQKKFDKIDSYGTNDEKEIYKAGTKVCDDLLTEIGKNSGFDNFQNPLKEKQKELQNKMEEISKNGYSFFTDNEVLINDIASEIDNAENEMQELMKKYQEEQKRKQAINEVKTTETAVEQSGKNYFDIDSDGLMTMTKAVNAPTIQTVLGSVFNNNTDAVYKIDYTNCTNTRIKEKMINTIGTPSCYIKYDFDTETYNLYRLGTDGKAVQTSQRALIWEGVTLIRDDIAALKARSNAKIDTPNYNKKETNEINNLNNIDGDPKWGPIKKAIPAKLLKKIKNSENGDLLKKFLVANENRLDEIIRDAKKHGYGLHTNPIDKKYSSGLMEVNLINGNAEKDVTLWEDENTAIGADLYDLLDGEESDYKTFLTTRIQQKWHDYDHLTKHENILSENENSDPKERLLDSEKKQGVVYRLNTLKTFIENMKNSEGNSWWNNNDQILRSMTKLIDDGLYSLNSTVNISEKEIKEKILQPLQKKRENLRSMVDVAKHGLKLSGPLGMVYSKLLSERKKQNIDFTTLLSDDSGKTIELIRNTSKKTTIYDTTESSFLKDEIVSQGKLELKNENINTMFQKISTDLELSGNEDGSALANKKTLIDGLYKCGTQQDIADFLANNNMLPKNWRNDEDVKEMILSGCTKLHDSLQAKRKQIENMKENSYNMVNQMKDGITQEKQLLEQKLNKTDEEVKRLQALTILLSVGNEQHLSQYLASMYSSSLDAMKYGGVGSMVQSSLASSFVEIGGGAKGDLGNIMNDIEGYGFWDLSDENTKVVGDICKEIAIMVVTSVLTAGIGGAAITGALSLARMGATGLKMTNMAMKLSKIIKISKASMKALRAIKGLSKGARMATYAIKGATTASSLLVEAPIFNSVNKLIHGATDGDFGGALDGLDLNPISKENIHTAAFLGALQVGGSIAKGIGNVAKTSKLGKAITTKVDFTKGLQKYLATNPVKNAGSMMTEFATMMGAEQTMNVTFGYETVDENGNIITERGIHWDQQGIITSIGMILGMRAVKPSLWHRIEQKMVDKNLQILNNAKNPKEPYVKVVDAKGQSKNVKLKDFVKNAEKYLNEGNLKGKEVQKHIDNQHKQSPESKKLNNQLKREEVQNKHELELLHAQDVMRGVDANLLSEPMKKLRDAGDISQLSSNDVKRVQSEIGAKNDGIWGPESLNRLTSHLDYKITGNKNHVKYSNEYESVKRGEKYREGVEDARANKTKEESNKTKEESNKTKEESNKTKEESNKTKEEVKETEGHKSKEINRKSEEVNKEFKEAEKRGNYKDINLDQVAKTKQNATAFLKGTQQRIREFSGEITKNTKKFIGRLKAKMSEIAKNFPSLKDKIMEYRVNLETKVIDSMNKQEYDLFKNELGREISVLKDHGGSKEAINKLTNSYLDCIGVKESLQICEKEIALNKIKGKDNAKLIEEKTNLEQKLGEKMNEFYKIRDEVTPKNKTVKEKSENPKQTEEVKEKKEEVNKTKEDDSRNDMADMFKETSRDFSEKYGGSDAIGKFIDKNQYSAYHRQIWLYNKFVSSRENSYNLENGGKAEYKLHINATEQNFETVVKEFGNFFLENKIGAKVAPGIKVSKAEMGKQQGKIFTVYAKDHAEMMAVVNKAKEIYKTHNVEGISYSELKNNNANLQYELPIKETGGLVYYGLESYSPTQDGNIGYIGYNGYSERLDLMKKNKGSGPLDNLADWSVLENK